MKFSIITPVKNLEKYIAETIESVLNQKGDFEIEYIIMDGDSNDKTLEICNDYKNQIEKKTRKIFCNSIDMHVYSTSDNSMYEALSNGLQKVTGDVVAYINADDFYLPNAFSCVNEIFFNYAGVKWLTGFPIRYNEKGQIINLHVTFEYNTNLILKGFYGKELSFIQQEVTFWRIELNNTIVLDKLSCYQFAGDFFLWYSFALQRTQLFIVDSLWGGSRLREGQLSTNKEGYYKEYDSIKDRANFLDYIKGALYWVMEKFAGKPVKRRLSKNRISYKNGSWLLNKSPHNIKLTISFFK